MQWKALISILAIGLGSYALAQTGASPTPSPSVSVSPSPSPSPVRQVYSVQLSPVNQDPTYGAAVGFGRVVVDGDSLGVYLQMTGLAPGMQHPQLIHSGAQCPDFSADVNNDGYVDVKESEAVTGPGVIPLSLSPGFPGPIVTALFPTPSADGAVTYIGSASLKTLFGGNGASPSPSPSLSPSPTATPTGTPTILSGASPSPSPSPGVVSLEGRVIGIHGLSPSAQVPGLVTSVAPVACGTLVKLLE